MSERCTGTPVSWLALERYRLGEVDEAERARIASHVAGCEACAACLARIQEDEAVPLPPLSTERAARVTPIRPRLSRGWLAVAGGLAVAAAALVGLGSGWRSPGSLAIRTKGGDVAFTLVRDDDARIADASGVFRDGDRFKALVTCPPGANLGFDLLVLDAQGASFPFDAPGRLACGNEVPLPGAFRLTGTGEETVCLVWGEGAPPDRSALGAATGRAAFGERAICKTLTPGAGAP